MASHMKIIRTPENLAVVALDEEAVASALRMLTAEGYEDLAITDLTDEAVGPVIRALR